MLLPSAPRSLSALWVAAQGFLPVLAPRGAGMRFLLPRRFRAAARPEAQYTVQATGGGVRNLTAWGNRAQVTQALLDGIRAVPGPWGLVVVELGDAPREWVAASLPRSRVLEGFLALRDLIAAGGMDVAVFSGDHGIEIFLDRWGLLEIRTGGWWEPRLRSVLEARGFRSTGGKPPASEARREPRGGAFLDPTRVAQVCASLGLDSPEPSSEPVPDRDRRPGV